LRSAPFVKTGSKCIVVKCENGCGKQTSIDGTGATDSERADRNACWHLHNRKERVLSGKGFRLHWHTKDRKRGHGCCHAGKVSCATGAGDHDLEALSLCAFGESDEAVWCAMRRDDAGVKRNSCSASIVWWLVY
jgi:hypothetical protein